MKTLHSDEQFMKTHNAILRTFVQMLSERKYSYMTITDLAARVKINRKTFYLHYDCLDSLKRDLEKKLALEILRIEWGFWQAKNLPGMVNAIFRYCYQHPTLFHSLFLGPNYYLIFEQVSTEISALCTPVSPRYAGIDQPLVDVFMFNIFHIYRKWLQLGSKTSLEDVIFFTENLVCYGMFSLPDYGFSNFELNAVQWDEQDFGFLFHVSP